MAPAVGVLLLIGGTGAQIPTKCLEIEGVLVDACNGNCPGAQEGENEMFRFITGPSPIQLSDLLVIWATPNVFLGWVQNATTASITAQLNATITNCGYLIEPPAGIIPAGKRVLGITSTNLCLTGNSFAALADTLYVIFQAPGNTFGHFKNHNNSTTTITASPTGPPAFRTFVLGLNSTQCTDSVTYNTSLLVNMFGTYGGSYNDNDGSSLVVSWPGTPQVGYVNFGCQAPVTPFAVNITTQPGPQPCGASVGLEATATGNLSEVYWTGGTGTFSSAASTNTQYTLAAGETSGALLQFCAVSACGDTICDTIQLEILAAPIPLGSATTDPVPCGSTTPVSGAVTGSATTYFWQGGTGVFADANALSTTYTLGSGDASAVALSFCAVGSCADTTCSTVQLDVAGAPVAGITASGSTTICEGSTVTLTATGGSSYTWSSGALTEAITVSTAGTYSVVANNPCGQSSASVDIMVATVPVATVNGPGTACTGEDIELIADGGSTYLWSTGATTPIATVTGPGTYTVTVNADCGTDQASITVLPGVAFEPAFSPDSSAGCAPLCVSFEADDLGAVSYTWNFGDGASGEGIAIDHCFAAGDHAVSLSVAPLDGDPRCPASITLVDPIHAWALPVARFSTDPNTITMDAPLVHFIDESSGASNLLWHFDAFEDSTSTDLSPSITFPGVGCYTVVLEVMNSQGCSAETARDVCVEDAFSVWVPNAFTPNNDGINDNFFLVTSVRDPSQFELLIFDRWGGQLFAADRPATHWDGSGTPSGVYVWKLRMRDTHGQVQERIGHVVLVR